MTVRVLIAARDEAKHIATTVESAAAIDGVDEVVVVDDGSVDGTAMIARGAGARVLVAPQPVGKGGALEGALDRLRPVPRTLFLDADLGRTAGEAGPLLAALDHADLTIGVLPRQAGHGGFRLVKRAAAGMIESLSGFRAAEPLSGQRAATAEVLAAVRPLATGFGVETAMTVDAVRLGFRVAEVPVSIAHRVTGRDLEGFLHRARQGRDLLTAVAPRIVGLR